MNYFFLIYPQIKLKLLPKLKVSDFDRSLWMWAPTVWRSDGTLHLPSSDGPTRLRCVSEPDVQLPPSAGLWELCLLSHWDQHQCWASLWPGFWAVQVRGNMTFLLKKDFKNCENMLFIFSTRFRIILSLKACKIKSFPCPCCYIYTFIFFFILRKHKKLNKKICADMQVRVVKNVKL